MGRYLARGMVLDHGRVGMRRQIVANDADEAAATIAELPGVEHVVVVMAEARETRQNARDMKVMFGLRNQRLIKGPFKLKHVPGPKQPLLAVADIVVGAVAAGYGGDRSYREILDSKITEIVI